jgi:ABC-type transport system substrate-binding protein
MSSHPQKQSEPPHRPGRLTTYGLALGLLAVAVCSCTRKDASDERPEPGASAETWTLRDSAPYNLTSLDPVAIVDAFTINVLANVYEGLATIDENGRIAPGLAESWETSPDGTTWTFTLRPDARFHPPAGEDEGAYASFNRAVEPRDVVYSLNRAAFAKNSFYGWLLSDLLADRGAIDFENGERHPDIRAIGDRTVQITLQRPFPLLNRLITVGGWIYPEGSTNAADRNLLTQTTLGTGPYRLKASVPDDRIELSRAASWWGEPAAGAPDAVAIRVISDPVAALEAFKAGTIDQVELDLGTVEAGRRLARDSRYALKEITANYLDYIVVSNQEEPFADQRVRRALNLAIDRAALSKVVSGFAEPAYGFVPPPSPAFRGESGIQDAGFAFAPAEARTLLEDYLQEQGLAELDIEVAIDAGEFPESIAQYVQAMWREHLPMLRVTLNRITWPELLQQAFSGGGRCYRFWWNIVTPSEDLYFLFYFPGQAPPNGFNLSFYDNPAFADAYDDVFSVLDESERMQRIRELEDYLIADAAAIPLLHRRYLYLHDSTLILPVNAYLRKHYILAHCDE